MEKRLVPDLHLEELLIPGGQLLGPGAERQQQQQEWQQAVQQEHPAATTARPSSGGHPVQVVCAGAWAHLHQPHGQFVLCRHLHCPTNARKTL